MSDFAKGINVPINDCISRRAAIDAADRADYTGIAIEDVKKVTDEVVKEIKKLPSVQPEPCEDAVNRRRLLSDLEEMIAAWKKYPVLVEQIKGIEAVIEYLETIPPVTPQRKKGKWIDEPVYKQTMDGKTWDGYTYCSECREMHEYGYRSKYCQDCGAEMTEGESNEYNSQN